MDALAVFSLPLIKCGGAGVSHCSFGKRWRFVCQRSFNTPHHCQWKSRLICLNLTMYNLATLFFLFVCFFHLFTLFFEQPSDWQHKKDVFVGGLAPGWTNCNVVAEIVLSCPLLLKSCRQMFAETFLLSQLHVPSLSMPSRCVVLHGLCLSVHLFSPKYSYHSNWLKAPLWRNERLASAQTAHHSARVQTKSNPKISLQT